MTLRRRRLRGPDRGRHPARHRRGLRQLLLGRPHHRPAARHRHRLPAARGRHRPRPGILQLHRLADQDLPTGTELRNIAYITFDGAETIATNQVDPHDPSQGTDPEKEVPIAIAPPFAYLTTIAGTGGSVAAPGEGQFQYAWGETVPITAVADDEDSAFVGWSGDIQTVADPFAAETTIGLYEDFSVTANFVVAEPVSVPWRLQPGFNLVALPHDPTVPNLADRLDEIGAAPSSNGCRPSIQTPAGS